MDYTPFQYTDALAVISTVAFIFTVASLMLYVTLGIGSSIGSMNVKEGAVTTLFVSGIFFVLLSLALVVYGMVTDSTPDARKGAYLREAATSLSETYGIEVTEQNIKELRYPADEQTERRYFGTTVVKTGPNVTDFITARLAYDDGKVYLLQQVGEDYKELEPVR